MSTQHEGEGRWIPILNTGVCPACSNIYDLRYGCLCNKLQRKEGNYMGEVWFTCPFCGKSHLMILGATVKLDKDRSIVAVCPNTSTAQK
jgi:hypothetical protein